MLANKDIERFVKLGSQITSSFPALALALLFLLSTFRAIGSGKGLNKSLNFLKPLIFKVPTAVFFTLG